MEDGWRDQGCRMVSCALFSMPSLESLTSSRFTDVIISLLHAAEALRDHRGESEMLEAQLGTFAFPLTL